MASLENRTGYYNVVFYFGGRKFTRSLETADFDEADTARKNLEQTIRLVKTGHIEIPPNADIPTFLMSRGKLASPVQASVRLTLKEVIDRYLQAHPDGSLEPTTLYTIGVHTRNVFRVLGEQFPVDRLAVQDLQRYVNARAKQKGHRGKAISPTTIRKEIKTLSAIWTWAGNSGLVGPFPNNGLVYPKIAEKPPFMTWAEIARQIERGVPENKQADLWDCLYLDLDQINELLDHVRETANQPFIHPMLATAAHTGCRRSELLRSEIPDIDLDQGIITIRERKRVRGRLSTRRIPLSASLCDVLAQWLDNHPGGIHTFIQKLEVERSKKNRTEYGPITRDEANDHFRRAVAGSKWQVLKGYHVLRHSFISICASKGIDQRLIDEWVGHTSEETRRRYRHLFPSSQQEALKSVFG